MAFVIKLLSFFLVQPTILLSLYKLIAPRILDRSSKHFFFGLPYFKKQTLCTVCFLWNLATHVHLSKKTSSAIAFVIDLEHFLIVVINSTRRTHISEIGLIQTTIHLSVDCSILLVIVAQSFQWSRVKKFSVAEERCQRFGRLSKLDKRFDTFQKDSLIKSSVRTVNRELLLIHVLVSQEPYKYTGDCDSSPNKSLILLQIAHEHVTADMGNRYTIGSEHTDSKTVFKRVKRGWGANRPPEMYNRDNQISCFRRQRICQVGFVELPKP